MYLIDYFVPVLAFTVETLDNPTQADSYDYEGLRNAITELLEQQPHDSESPIPNALYQDAKFAVVTFIDEKVLNSSWSQRHQWAGNLLQKSLFETTNGGVKFFDKLDRLNPYHPIERDVIEVYFYCLCLGFSGCYYNVSDKAKLSAIVEHIGHALVDDAEEKVLFPEAYVQAKESEYQAPQRKVNLTPMYFGVPVVLLLALFVYFQIDIRDLAQQFLLVV